MRSSRRPSRRRAISRRVTIRSVRRSRRHSLRRWSASSRSRGSSRTTRRYARTAAPAKSAATSASTYARLLRSPPTAITSRSTPICAWAAGAALRKPMGFAETIVNALGYAGAHFMLLATDSIAALEQEVWALQPAATASKPATYNLSAEKRATLEFALEHLAKLAPKPQESIALGAGAPSGQVLVNKQTCTLCMACVGACPESALHDGRDQPMLKFIERNCVQCGLCEKTCPESAITLAPRLLLTAQAKQEVVLNEAEPFNCVRCGKPFGTRQMVSNMLGKLTGHSMFAGEGSLKRLQMCGDCRGVDMMENKDEISIQDGKK